MAGKKNGATPKADVMEVKDGRLIVDVALSEGDPSSSGKSMVYFSTRGNKALDDGYVIGMNLYKQR